MPPRTYDKEMSNQGKKQDLESFLNPSILRNNLIVVALYIAAFEFLDDSVNDRLVKFFANTRVPGADYESEVRQGQKEHWRASLGWLKKMNAIDDTDVGNFEKAKRRRDEIAHEMGRILWEGVPSDLPARFLNMVSLLDKIELWWTVNVDVTKPEEVDAAAIAPGKSLGLRLLMQVATLSEEESCKYLDEAVRLTRPPREKIQ